MIRITRFIAAAALFSIIFIMCASVKFVNDHAPQEIAAVTKTIEPERVHVAIEVKAAADETVEPEHVAPPKLYTDADAVALAQMVWGECRGVCDLNYDDGITITGTCQKAAAMWVVLNRYDAGFEESIEAVVKASYQFLGYSASNPVDDELLSLAYDVLERWNAEQYGSADVGRILPDDFMWFVGDGQHNHFKNNWTSGNYYTWELPDVYAEEV